ncbi:MAG: hypothetical protein JNN30_21125 [Rhodanobacteraceae bacterium]|nr:hypothetical protein [Rhodanobacteraceae bacterium]
MKTTPASYVAALQEAARTRQWDPLPELRRSICQHFANARDWEGMEAFFEAALLSAVPEETCAAVSSRLGHLPTMAANLASAFDRAVDLASNNPNVKALYCEYFYDGGDGSTVDLFPCLRFERNDDFWASEFEEVVPGSPVQSYFGYDPELEVAEPAASIARDYLHAKLFGVVGHLVEERVRGRYPFGFAEHDGLIVCIDAHAT